MGSVKYTTDKYLCGELRSDQNIVHSYHVVEENDHFVKQEQEYYRKNEIYRKKIDKKTGNLVDKILVIKNHSKVLYDKKYIPENKIRPVYIQ